MIVAHEHAIARDTDARAGRALPGALPLSVDLLVHGRK